MAFVSSIGDGVGIGWPVLIIALLALTILLGGVLVWLWPWLTRVARQIARQARLLSAHPRVVSFRRRFAPQIRFLQRRLSPEGALGLHLTAGIVVIVAAAWMFGGIAEDVVTADYLTVIDRQVADWFHWHATAALNRVVLIITFLGSPRFLTGASLLAALFFAWRRWWYRLLAFVLTMGGGTLLLVLLKNLFERSRPIFEKPLLTLSTYSFPSGHVMGTTLFCGSLAFIAFVTARTWRWRVAAILAALLFVSLIAFTRIYLGVHYLSDVLGAAAAGMAWLAFCLTAVETYRKRPQTKTAKPPRK